MLETLLASFQDVIELLLVPLGYSTLLRAARHFGSVGLDRKMRLAPQSVYALGALTTAAAETGYDGWLRYNPTSGAKDANHDCLPKAIHSPWADSTSPLNSAQVEVADGFNKLFGINLERQDLTSDSCAASDRIVIATQDQWEENCGELNLDTALIADGFYICTEGSAVKIIGQNERASLYGTFEYLSMVTQGNFSDVNYVDNPKSLLRMLNQWDDWDGSIIDGRGDDSLYFSNSSIRSNLTRLKDFGRFLSSVRYNTIIVNNLNSHAKALTSANVSGIARIADEFRPYGIRVGMVPYFSTPYDLNYTDTYDPLDPAVIDWWHNKTDEIYEKIPDFQGFLVKADSEGQPGPLAVNRTLAEGANMLAQALAPHDGLCIFRAFIYTTHNYSDWKDDRCKDQVDYFKDLDGQFDDNVLVQIKYGSLDFQVEEPANPLFSTLRNTHLAMEFEISQEYLGQQSHFVYQPVLWRKILDFDMKIPGNRPSKVSDIVTGVTTNRSLNGMAFVSGVRGVPTWQLNHMAMSNLYASGRIAWDPTLDVKCIFEEWSRLTFTCDWTVIGTLTNMAMDSWHAFRNYTGNLGIGTLSAVYTHYAEDPATADGPKGSRWFRHYADSIGMDRTCGNGTCYSGQYTDEVAQMFESVETTPEPLLLWFHHLPYSHILSSGKNIMQYFYDAHYSGAERLHQFPGQINSLKGKFDDQRWYEIHRQITYQAGHAISWRDSINNWFYNQTDGIEDDQGRVMNHPNRIEAEDMTLEGYKIIDVNPFEGASGFKAVVTTDNITEASVSTTLDNFETGSYDIAIAFFDYAKGTSNYTVYLNDKTVGEFTGDRQTWDRVASSYPDSQTIRRETFWSVNVNKGDTLKITGQPDSYELAPLDYVVLLPADGSYLD